MTFPRSRGTDRWRSDLLDQPEHVHLRAGNGINTTCGVTNGRHSDNRDRVTCPACLTSPAEIEITTHDD